MMRARSFPIRFAVSAAGLLVAVAALPGQHPAEWKAHDMERPRPRLVKPALPLPVPPPSDAVVLFDGSDLSKWRSAGGGPAKWVVRDGYMESVRGSGYVYTRDSFGDVQLHVEFATPTPPEGKGQGRGNSGVFLMGRYEVQVLDSYDNVTYADGQAGALYGQYPPLVNASRPPGEWQSFDIVFRRPRFHRDGRLNSPARLTVFHNGVLVQESVEAWGPTSWLQHFPYEPHRDKLPLSLQDHGNPVRYRNIWLRELDEWTKPGPTEDDAKPLITLQPEELERYVGVYQEQGSSRPLVTVSVREGRLYGAFYDLPPLELLPHSEEEFSLRWTAAALKFELEGPGKPTAATFHIGGEARRGERVK